MAYRSTLTQTTLELGSEMDELHGEMAEAYSCQRPLLEYINLDVPADMLESQVAQWVRVRGPVVAPDAAGGYPEDIADIWQHMCQKDMATEELAKREKTLEKQNEQIETVTASKARLLGQDDPRLVKLQDWAKGKLDDLGKQVTAQKVILSDSTSKLSAAIRGLLKKFQVPNQDTEVDALFAEVEQLFGDMTMVTPPDLPKEKTDVVMDATTLALEQCNALPDGPQKSAILAVLETAMVRKANQI